MNFHWLDSGPSEAAFNMALDEALLETAAHRQQPVLRFYGWTEPAATFGYFQRFAEVERTTLLRPLLRRPTGGGMVPHASDWTYSLTFPPGNGWHRLRAEDSYRRTHEWIQSAFATLGVATELATECRRAAPGQCFVGHEKFDLLWQGRKIAGAAQRRNQMGLLVQGSIQPPPLSLRRNDWQSAMRTTVPDRWTELVPDPALLARTRELVAQKYSRHDYLQRR